VNHDERWWLRLLGCLAAVAVVLGIALWKLVPFLAWLAGGTLASMFLRDGRSLGGESMNYRRWHILD
jgi:hypothetical protein